MLDTCRVLSFEERSLAFKARKIGRELPQIRTTNSGAPPGPTEHAMIEAAIHLDLITPEQAEALVKKGKTLGEWLMAQEKGKAGKTREVRQKVLDRLRLLALLLINFAVLAAFGWIVIRIVRWL
jgi:hypothetical protein